MADLVARRLQGMSAADLRIVGALSEHAPPSHGDPIAWALIQFDRFKVKHQRVLDASFDQTPEALAEMIMDTILSESRAILRERGPYVRRNNPTIRPSTERLFRLWHDGVPSKVISVETNWAPHYGYMGVMSEISYASYKWSDKVKSARQDVPAEYRHVFEGAPCHVWGAMHDGRAYRLGRMPADMPRLATLLELCWRDAEEELHELIFERARPSICAVDGRRIAIVDPQERFVPLLLTNTIVGAEGIDDR